MAKKSPKFVRDEDAMSSSNVSSWILYLGNAKYQSLLIKYLPQQIENNNNKNNKSYWDEKKGS